MNGDLSKEELEKRLEEIEKKLDIILAKLNDMDGIKGFGVSLAANFIGNLLDSGKRQEAILCATEYVLVEYKESRKRIG